MMADDSQSFPISLSMPTTTSLLDDHFGPLQKLPCWEADTEFTCWLKLRFGTPCIRVREERPESVGEPYRRRRVQVVGEYLLFFEMGDWEYMENGKRLYHSGQSRLMFRRLAQRLQSQCLSRIALVREPADLVFEFDLGGTLQVRPSVDAKADDLQWYLRGNGRCLEMIADGTLSETPSGAEKTKKIKAKPTVYSLI